MGGLCNALFNEIKDTERFVSAMAVSSRAEVSVASWHCAGFFRLHERVQEKELTSESITVEGTGRGTTIQKTSRCVAKIAAGELERYKALPSSDRWTWGGTLTKDEVLDLQHIHKQEVCTGYGTNLPQGTLSGEFSATNTTPPRSANMSGVPQSVQRAPSPTSLLFPSNIGSYALNSASDARDAAGSEVRDPAMEPSEATDQEEAEEDVEDQENVTDHGDHPMDVDDVTQSAAGGAEDKDATSVAADMWLDDDVTQPVAGGPQAWVSIQAEEEDNEVDAVSLAADLWLATTSAVAGGATDAHVAEEAVGKYDNDDPASLAADIWLDAQGTQSIAGHADNLAVAGVAILSASTKEEQEDNVHDAASVEVLVMPH